MEKKKIKTDIGESKEFDANYSATDPYILDVVKWLTDAYKAGATHIHFEAHGWEGDCDEITAQTYQERDETDQECIQRMINEEHERIKDAERKKFAKKILYEQLKTEFEPEN